MADMIIPLASQGFFTFKRPLSGTVLVRHTDSAVPVLYKHRDSGLVFELKHGGGELVRK